MHHPQPASQMGEDADRPRWTADVRLTINGERWEGTLDARTSLLDALTNEVGVNSAKRGCDHGQCGACTVLVDGRRILSCLALAASCDGTEVTTTEGLGAVGNLSPLQAAFVECDGLQCGYCTPGQICSAEGMLSEARQGAPSHVTIDVAETGVLLTDAEIRERMSGNLCRCGAYTNIAAAIAMVADQGGMRP